MWGGSEHGRLPRRPGPPRASQGLDLETSGPRSREGLRQEGRSPGWVCRQKLGLDRSRVLWGANDTQIWGLLRARP